MLRLGIGLLLTLLLVFVIEALSLGFPDAVDLNTMLDCILAGLFGFFGGFLTTVAVATHSQKKLE